MNCNLMGGEQLESNKQGNFDGLVVSFHPQQRETRRKHSIKGATSSWKVAEIVSLSARVIFSTGQATDKGGAEMTLKMDLTMQILKQTNQTELRGMVSILIHSQFISQSTTTKPLRA